MKPMRPAHYRRYIWVCVTCGKREIDERPTVQNPAPKDEELRIVRCETCTKTFQPLPTRG